MAHRSAQTHSGSGPRRRGGGSGPLRGAVAAILLLGAAVAAAGTGRGAVPTSPLDGLPIVSIRFVRKDVFDTSDPATSGWFYRTANALHIVTRESYLRARLLFKVGDPYSEDRAQESARILRELGWLNPVTITARRKGRGVEVVVTTRDLWTLQAGIQLGVFGNSSRTGVTFWEQNFLGLGKQVNVSYQSTFERRQWTYSYLDPDLLGSRKRLWLEHQDTSDGVHDEGSLTLPFYSLDSRRAWGISFVRQHLDEYLWEDAEKAVSGRHDITSLSAWGGFRVGSRAAAANRLTVGWDHRIDGFVDWAWIGGGPAFPDPEDRHIEGPRIGFEHLADNYQVVHGFRAWSSQEDVALGPNVTAHTTCSVPALGDGRWREPFDASYHRGWRRGRWIVLADLWTSGRLEAAGARNWLTGGQLVAARIGDEGWQGRLVIENVGNADREVQLHLGTFTGLRGWDPFTFNGTGRALLNLQWRRLMARDVLGLFSLGMESFVDTGETWGGHVGRGTQGMRTDIGVGLVGDLTHIGLAHLLRVDLAVPDDGSGLLITATTHFLF